MQTLPWPHLSVTSNRTRTGKRPIVISFLGHQRQEKGYHLVPEIIRLLNDVPNVRFLIHNAAPNQLASTQNEIRLLAQTINNLSLDERTADGKIWSCLLETSDIVVCPYYPHRYASSHSALMAECIANAIPVVVPAGTVLAKMSQEYGGMAIEFQNWDAISLAKSIRMAVDQFDMLAERAKGAAEKWMRTQGIHRLVDKFLGT